MIDANLPPLRSERLLLRHYQSSDLDALVRLANDREIADTTLNIPHPYNLEAARQWISSHPQQIAAGALAPYAVTCAATGALFGTVSLNIDAAFRIAELGYWIGKPYWRQGICTEAADRLLRYGFETIALHRVHARHLARNPASGRVLRKIGMREEGLAREHTMKWGKYEDLVLYGMLKQDWDALQ